MTPQKKVFLGLGMITWSLVGMGVTNKAEKTFGLEPTAEDTEQLKRALPTISSVERGR